MIDDKFQLEARRYLEDAADNSNVFEIYDLWSIIRQNISIKWIEPFERLKILYRLLEINHPYVVQGKFVRDNLLERVITMIQANDLAGSVAIVYDTPTDAFFCTDKKTAAVLALYF